MRKKLLAIFAAVMAVLVVVPAVSLAQTTTVKATPTPKVSSGTLAPRSSGAMMPSVSPVASNVPPEADFQNSLSQFRQSANAFSAIKTQEAAEQKDSTSAKTAAGRSAAKQKLADIQKSKETKRKEVLLKIIDIQIKQYNRLNDRVQKMPNIKDDLKAQLKTEIDAVIQKLNDEKTKVQSASGSIALKKLAVEIRNIIKTHRDTIHEITDAIHASRVNGLVTEAEARGTSLKNEAQKLKAQGKDTSSIDADAEEADSDIADAKSQIGQNQFGAAVTDLKKAYEKFSDMAQKEKSL